MERNRDLRRAAISTSNGLPRRRQRITTLKDSTDEDRQMELQETVRLRDRERLQKKDRDREFPKRRRVDRSAVQQRSGGGESFRENDSTDSSHEEYYEEEEEEEETNIRQQNRLNQLSPTSSSLSNNRRGLRTLRSSPVLRAAADEMLGVPIPRRARSSSAKRLHEYWNSGSGGFGEDLSHRKFSPYPATVSLIGSGGASPPPPDASVKKKMKSVEPKSRGLSGVSNSRPASVIQDDIEIEVAEALFDLMKQSQPESQSSQKQQKVDRDTTRTADDGLKAEGDKDENNAFSVHNEQSIKVNAETIVVDSVKELKKEGRMEREKFLDDTAQELVSGDRFVNKGKVGSPKGKESPSCVKVNACDIQDPTVTKAANAEILVEAKKETRLEIDLMAPPPLPSSPEREALVEMATDPKVMVQDVQKKSETTPKNGPLAVSIHMQEEKVGVISSNQLPNLELEKCRHEILSVSGSTTQQLKARKEQKIQSPASLVPFPIGMSSWAAVLPHPGYMPALQAVLPIDGSARSSMTMQHPQFKLSQPRPKRCATHQHIAQSIHSHQQLIKKSLSSGPTDSVPFYGTKSLNPKSMLPPTQKFIPGNPFLGEFQERQNLATISGGSGKDKSSDATTNEKSLLQQASHQASANNFLHGPGFIFPLGHHQTTMMAPANSSGPPQSASVSNSSLPSNSAGRTSTNLPLPGGSALSFNHSMFTSSEAAAATYMAILQNNGCPVPTSTNIAMPPFKAGTATIPFFNSPFYSSQMFNVQSASQSTSTFSGSSSHKLLPNQQQTSTKIIGNKAPTQPEKQFQSNKHGDPHQQSSKGRTDLIPQTFALSFGSNASTAQALTFSSMAQNSAIFQMLPDIARNGNQIPHQKNFQTSGGSQSFNFSKSDFAAKFDGFNFLPSSLTGIQPFQSSSAGASVTIPNSQQHQNQQQQLIQLQKNQMQQLTGAASNPNNSSFLPQWENFHRTTGAAPEGSSQSATSTLVNIPQLKNSQGQTNITFGNSPASFQGQQIAIKSQPVISIGKGVCSSVSALPAQETENGSNQKSSPACRRNVPSILSTCPTQLSELKY